MNTAMERVDETGRRIEARIAEWTAWVPDFEPSYAHIGLFTARHYLGRAAQDEERLFWLALVIVYWLWVDDRSDGRLSEQTTDWAHLVRVLEGGSAIPSAPVPELDFLLRVERGLGPLAQSSADVEAWRLSAARVLDALRREEEASRQRRLVAYAEYLEVGGRSIAVGNMAAAAALLLGLPLARLRADFRVHEVERHFCAAARLENDLFSEQRDRREGGTANALLILEAWMGGSGRGFITSELGAYRRLLEEALAALGLEHAFGRLIRRAVAGHAAVYETFAGVRYASDHGSPPG
jgi:hypothetical protein